MNLNSISKNWHLFTVSRYFEGPANYAGLNFYFMKIHNIPVGGQIKISNLKNTVENFITYPYINHSTNLTKIPGFKGLKLKSYIESLELIIDQFNQRLVDKLNQQEEIALSKSALNDFNLGQIVLVRYDQPKPELLEKPF